MTAPEIEKAARDAGLELTDASNGDCLVFTRGPHILIANTGATCICHSDVRRRRTMHGYTFGSLSDFLTEFPTERHASGK